MYLVKYISKINLDNIIAVSDPKTLFDIVITLEKSENCVAWNLLDHKPEDFGWAGDDFWDKYAKEFKQEHFDQSIG